MHLILTGATGLVGSATLAQLFPMIQTGQVTRLSILTRKPLIPLLEDDSQRNSTAAAIRERIAIIPHSDFEHYPAEVLQKLKGAEGVVWALGVSTNGVDKETYIKITLDYAIAAAKAFSTLSEKFKFVYVSGQGATTTPSHFLSPLFAVVKGQAEFALLNLSKQPAYSSLRIYSARPGFVDAHDDPAVIVARERQPTMRRLTEKALAPVLRALYTNGVSPTKMLGAVLLDLAMGDGEPFDGKSVQGVSGEGRTLENSTLREIYHRKVGRTVKGENGSE